MNNLTCVVVGRLLISRGVTVLHECKVLQEKEGLLSLSNGQKLGSGLCIWATGLVPNPMLHHMGLPLTAEGYVMTDEYYRVKGAPGVYSIGDCAHIVDADTGRPDGKTCKEASAQAARLGKIIAASLTGRRPPVHKGFIEFFCFGLGFSHRVVVLFSLLMFIKKDIFDLVSFRCHSLWLFYFFGLLYHSM